MARLQDRQGRPPFNRERHPSSGRSGRVGLRRQWRNSFLVMACALLVALSGTLAAFVQVVDHYQGAARELDQAMTLTAELGTTITDHEGRAHALWQGSPIDRVDYQRQQDQITALFQQAAGVLHGPGEAALLQHAALTWQRVLVARGLWGSSAAARLGVTGAMQSQFGAQADDVYQTLDRLTGLALSDASGDLHRADDSQLAVFALLAVIFTLLLAVMAYFVRRMTIDIVRPLEALRAGAVRLRDGELDHRIEISAKHESNEVGELAATLNAMAAALADTHLDLRRRAAYDSLTGLANRATFSQRLATQVNVDAVGTVGVLFVDIDDFKVINDALGHAVGDALLVAAAGRLSSCVASRDVVARLGGDEFAILVGDASAADRIAARILEAFAPPFDLDGRRLTVTVSIGVSTAEANSGDADRLLAEADFAMYTAKRDGKGRRATYDAPDAPDASDASLAV